MIKWFLDACGFPSYKGASNATVQERFLHHVDNQDLSVSQANDAIRTFFEYGGKEFRLYTIDDSATEIKLADTGGQSIEALSDARIRRLPPSPTMNYRFADGDHVRVSLSETHKDLKINPETEATIRTPHTVTVVYDGVLSSREFYVALDPPRRIQPHGDGAVGYYEHHLGKIKQYTGLDTEPLDLSKCLVELEQADYVELVRTEGKSKGLRVRLVSVGEDVRKDKLYKDYVGVRKALSEVTVVWLPEHSQDAKTAVPRISRKVKTKVNASLSSVHFMQGTLAHEANYVMERLRAIA